MTSKTTRHTGTFYIICICDADGDNDDDDDGDDMYRTSVISNSHGLALILMTPGLKKHRSHINDYISLISIYWG